MWTLKHIQDRCQDDGGCWIWTQAVNSRGYPIASIDGKCGRMVRRAVLEMTGKAPTKKKGRAHSRCSKRCVNPEHLSWSGFSEVLSESYTNGSRCGPAEYVRRLNQSKKQGLAKLDWPQVNEIRARATERAKDLAREFGVYESTIRKIVSGESWRVADPFRPYKEAA